MANLSSSLDRRSIIRERLVNGERADRRKPLDFPKTAIAETKCSNPENVSVSVRVGNSRVSCCIKLDMREPEPGMELYSVKVISGENMSTVQAQHPDGEESDNEIEMDNGEENTSLNLQREAVLYTILEELDVINKDQLTFLPNKFVIRLHISIFVIQDDGSVLDAAVLAIMAALLRLKFPLLSYNEETDSIMYDWNTLSFPERKIETKTSTTFAVIKKTLLACPSAEEEQVADAVIISVGLESGDIGFMQVLDGFLPTDDVNFSSDLLPEIVSVTNERRKVLEELLAKPTVVETDFAQFETANHFRINLSR